MKTKKAAIFVMALSAVMVMGSVNAFARGHHGARNNKQYSTVQTTVPTQVVATQTEIPVATQTKDIVVTNVPIETIIQNTTPATAVPAATITPATKTVNPVPVVTNTTPAYTSFVCPYGNEYCNQAGYCINNGNCYGNGCGNGNGYGRNGGGCRGYRY